MFNVPKRSPKVDITGEGKELFREGILSMKCCTMQNVIGLTKYLCQQLCVSEVYQNTKLVRTTLKSNYIFMYDCIVFINIVYSGLCS